MKNDYDLQESTLVREDELVRYDWLTYGRL